MLYSVNSVTLTADNTEVTFNKAFSDGGVLNVLNPSGSTGTGTITFTNCPKLDSNLATGKGGFAYFDNKHISLKFSSS